MLNAMPPDDHYLKGKFNPQNKVFSTNVNGGLHNYKLMFYYIFFVSKIQYIYSLHLLKRERVSRECLLTDQKVVSLILPE